MANCVAQPIAGSSISMDAVSSRLRHRSWREDVLSSDRLSVAVALASGVVLADLSKAATPYSAARFHEINRRPKSIFWHAASVGNTRLCLMLGLRLALTMLRCDRTSGCSRPHQRLGVNDDSEGERERGIECTGGDAGDAAKQHKDSPSVIRGKAAYAMYEMWELAHHAGNTLLQRALGMFAILGRGGPALGLRARDTGMKSASEGQSASSVAEEDKMEDGDEGTERCTLTSAAVSAGASADASATAASSHVASPSAVIRDTVSGTTRIEEAVLGFAPKSGSGLKPVAMEWRAILNNQLLDGQGGAWGCGPSNIVPPASSSESSSSNAIS